MLVPQHHVEVFVHRWGRYTVMLDVRC
jgi:hypothetical protein